MKRIIFVTDSMTSGGAERVISILANKFSNKYNVVILCLRKSKLFYEISPKVDIVSLDDKSSGLISKFFLLRRFIEKDDIVVPFMVEVYDIVLLSQLFRKRIIIPSERNDPRYKDIIWKLLRWLLLPKATAFVVQTETIKCYFPRFIQKKTTVIYNPINATQYYHGLWNQSSKVILAIGRTDRQKNYPMMLKAFYRIHQDYPEYELQIWSGRGEQEEELKAWIEDKNALAYIKLMGRTQNVSKEYSKAYMFVMTSNYEGFSNSLMEALCSGIPVVSTKVSGALDVIKNNKNGMLVGINDEKAFYESMKLLLTYPDLASSISEEAKKVRPLFDEDTICTKWYQLIEKYA